MFRPLACLSLATVTALIGLDPAPASAQFDGSGYEVDRGVPDGSLSDLLNRHRVDDWRIISPRRPEDPIVSRPGRIVIEREAPIPTDPLTGYTPPSRGDASEPSSGPGADGEPVGSDDSDSLIPPSLVRGLAPDAKSGAQLDVTDRQALRRYIDSGMPTPQFAVPRPVIENSGRFGDRQRRAIADQLSFLDTMPADRLDATAALSVGNLAGFAEESPEGFSWDRLDTAMRYATYNALKRGLSIEDIRFLTPEQRERAAEEQLRLLAPSYPTGSKIFVYPISVDGRPIVEIEPPAVDGSLPGQLIGGGLLMTGGAPTGSPGRGDLPVVNPVGNPLLAAAGATLAYRGGGTVGSGEIATCGTDDRPCFLSTVALHDRFRLTCSGVLIAPDKVLTAAHCACDSIPSQATIGSSAPLGFNVPPAKRVTVTVAGQAEFLDPEFCTAYRKARRLPETYAGGDLAVLTLQDRLGPDGRSPFAVIAATSRVAEVRDVEIAGFGARRDDPFGGEKYFAQIAVASPRCDGPSGNANGASDAETYGCHSGNELVAIDRNALLADSCNGDSGAGAQVRLQDGSFALIGIVSRGLNGTCGDGGIYSLVPTDRVRTWLRAVAPEAVYETGELPLADTETSTTNREG